MKFLVFIIGVVTVVCGTPVPEENGSGSLLDSLNGSVKCLDTDNPNLCIKESFFDALTDFQKARSLKLFDGVSLNNDSPRKSRSFEPLSTDPEIKSKQLNQRFMSSLTDLIENGEIELSYDAEDDKESRSINDVEDEARGKKKKLKKKLKFLIPLVLLAKAKAIALVVLALLVIAASIFKLTLLAKLAFIIKIIAIIKALLAKKHAQEETWEIAQGHGWEPHVEHSHVEHAHVEHSPHGWEGGWSRSKNDGASLAYSSYAN